MTKRVTVLINLFRRKSEVHPVMTPRQIIFGKKFKTPLCKIGKLVMALNVRANNRTLRPRAFYAFYIKPNDGGTGHSVFKLSIEKMIITPKCKPVPMPEDVIQVVNEMGRQEGMSNGIHFCNINKESTLSDLYVDDDSRDYNSCASDKDWKMPKNSEVDLK